MPVHLPRRIAAVGSNGRARLLGGRTPKAEYSIALAIRKSCMHESNECDSPEKFHSHWSASTMESRSQRSSHIAGDRDSVVDDESRYPLSLVAAHDPRFV